LNSLADFAGVSRAQMYNVLAGNSSPSLDWIAKVAAVLERDAWELLVPESDRRR
jgi:DNA-binding phage protein